jgi:hypothetical protein
VSLFFILTSSPLRHSLQVVPPAKDGTTKFVTALGVATTPTNADPNAGFVVVDDDADPKSESTKIRFASLATAA